MVGIFTLFVLSSLVTQSTIISLIPSQIGYSEIIFSICVCKFGLCLLTLFNCLIFLDKICSPTQLLCTFPAFYLQSYSWPVIPSSNFQLMHWEQIKVTLGSGSLVFKLFFLQQSQMFFLNLILDFLAPELKRNSGLYIVFMLT